MSVAKFEKWQNLDGVTRNAVLQVVTKEATTPTTTTSTSFVDATDVFLAITPTSATSKILYQFSIPFTTSRASVFAYCAFQILRDSEVILKPYYDTSGPARWSSGYNVTGSGSTIVYFWDTVNYQSLDSPNTTNEIIYKLQFCTYVNTNSGTTTINYAGTTNTPPSVITLMEIAQ